MDLDKYYPVTDSRYIRNNIIRDKIKEQLIPIQTKLGKTFHYDSIIFIINSVNINQVAACLPIIDYNYCGDIVLLLTIVGEITKDDIINSLSSYTGTSLQIEEINSSFPFYFNTPKSTGEKLLIPGRYWEFGRILKFIHENILDNLDGGRIYLEAKTTIDDLKLNDIHLIFKDSENKILLDCQFQDSLTGLIITREVMNDNNGYGGIISMILSSKKSCNDYEKFKNE